MSPKLLAVAVIAVASLFSGCANNQIANSEQLDQQAHALASRATMTPQEALEAVAGQIAQAKADYLPFFAPSHMEQAEDALGRARKLYQGQAPAAEVLEATFKVEGLIEAARSNRQTVEKSLSRSLEHRKVLEGLGISKGFRQEYERVLDELLSLIRTVERGQLDQAVKEESKLLAMMTALEVRILKQNHLAAVDAMLEKARSIDADDYAEVTYTQAEQVLASANRFVETRYRDREGVKKVALEALNAATHAWQVGRESKLWVGLNKVSSEQKVLYVESLIARINQGVGVDNLGIRSLQDQAVAVAEKIERGEAKSGQSVVVYGQEDEAAVPLTFTPVPSSAGKSKKAVLAQPKTECINC